MSKKVVKAEPKFESALARLEKIVEEMESGELPLEDALKRYEEGVNLARFCSSKLNEVQKKIELLKKNAKGEWARKPFDIPEEENLVANERKGAAE